MQELDSLLEEYTEIERNMKAISVLQGDCAKESLVQLTMSTMCKLPNQSSTEQNVNYSMSTISLNMDSVSAIKCLNVLMNRQLEDMDELVQKLNKLKHPDLH